MTHPSESQLRERFQAAGQEHVFGFWERLDPAARARLCADLASVDLTVLAEHRSLIARGKAEAAGQFQPPQTFPLRHSPAEESTG